MKRRFLLALTILVVVLVLLGLGLCTVGRVSFYWDEGAIPGFELLLNQGEGGLESPDTFLNCGGDALKELGTLCGTYGDP